MVWQTQGVTNNGTSCPSNSGCCPCGCSGPETWSSKSNREIAAVAHLRRLQAAKEDPDRPGTTPGKPPPTRTRKATKSDDPYMRKGGKIQENAKMMDSMKMKNARKKMPQPRMAMGGMYGKKPQMMKGGQYKGKMHSYVGGGMVRDLETLRRK